MTVVNCPMCELRFATRTERDWHLRNEHRHAHTHHPMETMPAVATAGTGPALHPEPEDTP
jgi:hypothetical protein